MLNLKQSKDLYQQAGLYVAGGVASTLRNSMKPVPLYVKSAKGTRVHDVDGNTYIDYLLAYGPLILGHAHPELNQSIRNACENGVTYGLQHENEIRLAELLVQCLPCADKVVFSGSGTEAVMIALRLARAYTGKQKVVRFEGHYHGWSDSIFTAFPSPDFHSGPKGGEADVLPGTSGQSLGSLKDIILLPWNDPQALKETLKTRGHEIAAVITEPVMCNSGCILPQPGYLEQMRQWTEEAGVLLIFDEVITGFRLGLGGAHGRFQIIPDLVTMGKAVAGGIPFSLVAGKRSIMDLISAGKVNHLGTLNGNCVAVAAALSTIRILARDDGLVFARMEELTQKLADGLRQLMRKYNHNGVINQIGPVFNMMFIDKPEVNNFDDFQLRDARKYSRFAELMLHEGVLLRPTGLWYISAVHEEIDIEQTLQAADRALRALLQEQHD